MDGMRRGAEILANDTLSGEGPRLWSALQARRLALEQSLGATARAPATPSPPDDDADLNRVHLTGTLGSEPLLYDVGDHPVATLALACQHRWRTSTGSIEIHSTWFNLTAWEELAEQCGRQFHRGDRVYVEGHLHFWSETRPPHSYACHTIVLDRIVLLAAASASDEGAQRTP